MEKEKPKLIARAKMPDIAKLATEAIPSGFVEWSPGIFVVDIMRWFDLCRGPSSVRYFCNPWDFGIADHNGEQPALVKFPISRVERWTGFYAVPLVPHLPYTTRIFLNIGFHEDYGALDDYINAIFMDEEGRYGPTLMPEQALLITSEAIIAHHILALEEYSPERLTHLNIMAVGYSRVVSPLADVHLPTGLALIPFGRIEP